MEDRAVGDLILRSVATDWKVKPEGEWRIEMPDIFCSAMDCEFNGDDGKCHAKEVALSDHSIMTLWEGRQRYQKCKTHQKSRAAEETEQFFAKAVSESKADDDA